MCFCGVSVSLYVKRMYYNSRKMYLEVRILSRKRWSSVRSSINYEVDGITSLKSAMSQERVLKLDGKKEQGEVRNVVVQHCAMLRGMLELLYWRNAYKRVPSLPSDEVFFSTKLDVELSFFCSGSTWHRAERE
ncbi:hypothetical protein HBI70_009880 [Parastagonospora nodorum]|nr:hypothetical protein HBH49_172640 [Parastagonospora nodorum]KAH4594015.1 hypothetical protein HBH83_045960 [Parastagonospora nodorum]KAH5158142.1 hypothetical protein HBH69_073580 [Parastagonospora nodorum]KAH5233904.1 hypothetical protein HBI62_048360 [Parastagonospora nodorum]KAH5288280.1 hypothetical protein HBI70_009880 [Parastagonospora nodorum]